MNLRNNNCRKLVQILPPLATTGAGLRTLYWTGISVECCILTHSGQFLLLEFGCWMPEFASVAGSDIMGKIGGAIGRFVSLVDP